jgi:hypothetical protein
VITRRWWAAAWAGGLIALILGAGWLFGPMSFGEYRTLLEILSHHETHQGWSLHRLVIEYGASPAVARLVTITAAAGVLAAAWWWYRFRGGHEAVVFAASIGAALLVSPIVWSHYFLLLLAPLLVARVRWYALAAFAAASWLIAPPAELEEFTGWINELSDFRTRLAAVPLLILGTIVVSGFAAQRQAQRRSS